MWNEFGNSRRARLTVLRKLTGREKYARRAVAKYIVIVDLDAAQFRHRYRRGLRRRWLSVAQKFARVFAVGVRASKVFAEPTRLQLHVGAAFVALDDGAIVTLDTKFALLHDVTRTIGIVAADVQLAPFIDQVTVHQ